MFQALLKIKDQNRIRIVNLEWFHNSEKLPIEINYVEVISFTATDKELDFIYENFEGVPIASKIPISVWKGEVARFLFDNICLIYKL
jgi:hypothetical protein